MRGMMMAVTFASARSTHNTTLRRLVMPCRYSSVLPGSSFEPSEATKRGERTFPEMFQKKKISRNIDRFRTST